MRVSNTSNQIMVGFLECNDLSSFNTGLHPPTQATLRALNELKLMQKDSTFLSCDLLLSILSHVFLYIISGRSFSI